MLPAGQIERRLPGGLDPLAANTGTSCSPPSGGRRPRGDGSRIGRLERVTQRYDGVDRPALPAAEISEPPP